MNKNSRGFAAILVVLLVVALIGSVGYIVYRNTQSEKTAQVDKSEPLSLSPSPYATPTPSLSPTPNSFSGWKTFSSSAYKVNYPADFDIKELEGSVLVISKWGPTQKKDTEFYDGISLVFTPREIPNTTPKDYAQVKIDEIKAAGIADIISGPDPITINNYQGITYTEQGLGIFKTIVLQSNNGVLLMDITNSTNDPGNIGFSKTVDQILSTFEFIE